MATFILKHNTSGSTTSGELQYNTPAKTLVVGDGSNVVTIARMDNTNTGSFGITGDLFVSGNTNIVGNLTFGDNASIDTVTVVASLSSSLIPESTNAHDLGSELKYWKRAYISSITGSLSGSINNIDITSLSASLSQSIGNLNNTTYNHEVRINNLETISSSYLSFTQSYYNVSASISTSIGALNNSSANYNTRIENLEHHSQSLNDYTQSNDANINYLNTISASYLAFTSSYYTTSASFASRTTELEISASNQSSSLHALNLYTSSLKSAIDVTDGNLTVLGNLTVQGTQTALQSTTLNVKDINITIASGSTTSAQADGAGINIDGANVSMSWNNTNQRIELNKDFAVTGSISASTLIGIGNVTEYSASVNSRLNTNVTNINEVSASAWGAFQSASSYSSSLQTTINNVSQSVSNSINFLSQSFSQSLLLVSQSFSTSLSIVSESLNTFSSSYKNDSSSFDLRIDNLETISASYLAFTQSYYLDSASFDTRISASTLTFNDTTGQTGIDFTKVGTQVSAIASGLTTGSSVHFASITASNSISASATIYCDTLVATTLVGATLPVLQYTTQGTLGNILIKGDTSKSIHVIDTITFTGITETPGNSSQATGLLMTGSITASLGFSGSINGIGNVTDFSSSVDQRIKDATNEQFLGGFVTTSSFNSFTASQYVSNSYFATTSSLEIVSASAWGAFQSASSYSGSFYTTINNLSSSVSTSISASNFNITINSASVSAMSGGFDTRIQTLSSVSHTHSNKAYLDVINQNLATTSTGVQFASLGIGTAPDGTYELKVGGDIAASGDIVAFNTSDERLKRNIKELENGLEKINKISGYEFDWNEDLQKARKGHDVGILAHEIEQILPEAVTKRDNGYLAVDYEKIIPLLIQSVKELSAKVKELENK